MRLKFVFTLAVVCGLSFTDLQAQQTAKITSAGTGYLEYLPQDYNKNTNDYPIVIFLHGIGERGTTSTDPATIKTSVQKVANVGLAKNVKYGAQYPFILISPQLKSSYGTWPANYVMEVLNHVKKYLRVNNKRIYITGLSLGSLGTWTTLGAYPEVFAAAVPICAAGSTSKACAIAAENVPIWAFHGTEDTRVSYLVTTKMVNAVNACTPKPSPLAKVTLFYGMGHAIWDKVYKYTNAVDWMLGFTNGTTTTDDGSATNTPPTVSAGSDKSLTLPDNEVYIQGTASDSDGSIASYRWKQLSGGTVSMGGVSTSRLRAYNMVEGSYTFRLKVTDNSGAIKYDDVKVVVSRTSASNIAPVAKAGSDKSTSSTSITLTGSGYDSDGTIVSYKWNKAIGNAVTLTNAKSASVTVSGLQDGSYYFRLGVTDNDGATDYDQVKVVVSGSGTTATNIEPVIVPSGSTSNVAPVAKAGSDKSTSSKSITITGSGYDADGKIVSYKWNKAIGGAVTLTNANSASVTVSGMQDGTYYFRLGVTDNDGATDYDQVKVVVKGSSTAATSTTTNENLAPVAYAGENKRITTETATVKIVGSGYDKDGDIVSYRWAQYGGPDVTLKNRESSTVTVSGLREGKYYLKLIVKDNDGATDRDNMLIVVSES
jgi:ribosomal protein L14/predicted esterase